MKAVYTDGTDWVIADDADPEKSADAIWKWHTGEGHRCPWSRLPDNKPLSVCFEDDGKGKPDPGYTVIPPGAKIRPCDEPNDMGWEWEVIAPAGEWAAANEPTFLASTEY